MHPGLWNSFTTSGETKFHKISSECQMYELFLSDHCFVLAFLILIGSNVQANHWWGCSSCCSCSRSRKVVNLMWFENWWSGCSTFFFFFNFCFWEINNHRYWPPCPCARWNYIFPPLRSTIFFPSRILERGGFDLILQTTGELRYSGKLLSAGEAFDSVALENSRNKWMTDADGK